MSTENGESSPKGRGSPEAKAWAAGRAEEFGQAVKFWRTELDLTAIELANRTKEIGYPITRATIAKIESNSRNSKIDVCEVIALATALQVAPVDLIFPGLPDRLHRATPRVQMRSKRAIDWFSCGEDYSEMFDYRSTGPHTPRVENSIDLRKKIVVYERHIASMEQLPEIEDAEIFPARGDEEIELTEARNYRVITRSMQIDIEGRNGEVARPWWFDRISEPEDSSDGEG